LRYDYILIWGNGLKHVGGIANIIRNDENFNIVRIKKVPIGNMAKFVKDVYACDTTPWEHLEAKCRYLLKAPPQAVFILMTNQQPDEHIKGPTRPHIECRKMVAMKIRIRNAYNPRYANRAKRKAPLAKGVSHKHCVHGSDYEAQVEHVLKVVGWQPLAYYKRNDGCEYFFPYHLDAANYSLVDRKLNDLRAHIKGRGKVAITDTPHYQYARGNKRPYQAYFKKHFGVGLCEDHFPAAFDKLLREFRVNYVRPDGRKSHIIVRGNNILDGVHRAAIMKARGIEVARCLSIS
jgi:hypothetical protein